MKDFEAIRTRKEELARRIAGQRGRLSGQIQALSPFFSIAERSMALLRSAHAHLVWVAPAAGLILAWLFRRRRPRLSPGLAGPALVWLRRGLVMWRGGRWAYSLARNYLQSRS